ncbi:lysozyme inhibitor LprI family protein [Senegalia massiliensis]|uniref:DUF1311 domain-containing protein n=1 Tax=Senegalia massiliensis TaxID=1720316 RepID=A0A845R2Z0_9CLOT|nr:lysozyme inhibitor LprI family protein [Senegalia massiliensis]NBI08329.1 DUF1311 domain-containing protein [Senegalia massiliensis]
MKNKKCALFIVITLSIMTLVACRGDNEENKNSTSDINQNQQVEDNIKNTVTKVKGRRKEFIERLDNIQEELNALPEKKDSDKGSTNAMKSYYGKAYEMYDEELNDIYALLKQELSPEVMENLKAEQLKWIKEKEEKANKEMKKYEGGTFELVSNYVSLYESTKERCYELVNQYMTD